MSSQAARPPLTTLLAGALVGVAVLLAATILVMAWVLNPVVPLFQGDFRPFNVVTAIGFSVAGFAIVRRQPGNLIGWLFIAGAIGNGLFGAGLSYILYDFGVRHGSLPGASVVFGLTFADWIPLPASFAFTLALFPDGRPLTPRWRPVLYAIGLGFGLWFVGAATAFQNAGAALDPRLAGLQNPFALPFGGEVATAGLALGQLGAAGAAVSLILRFRRSRGVERQQLKWLTLAAVPLLLNSTSFFVGANVSLSALAVALLAIPITLAILKYGLYEVDLVINRAIVYGALSAIVVVFYVAVVGAAAVLASGRRPDVASVLATVAAALLVLPLRQRLQRVVDRLLYGRRREPLSVVNAVGRRLEAAGTPETVLRGVVVELADALRLAGLEISLAEARIVATFGSAGEGAVKIALVHQGDVVGELVATPRRGEDFSPRDLRLLEDLCPQLAVALEALQLTDELRRSRQRLVMAREEERRRIRRDLHDSLGPTLTGVAMQADAARNLLTADPAAAAELLAELRSELTSAISEIRKLVYGLRPPALDEVGLVEALRQQAERFSDTRREGSMAVEVEAPKEMRDLPAAVEVAAFRIAAEAINNAARHAGAAHCLVRLTAGEALEVEVVDDGAGLPADVRSGVGLASMRERAEELGGRLMIGAGPGGGSRVLASLPLRGKT